MLGPGCHGSLGEKGRRFLLEALTLGPMSCDFRPQGCWIQVPPLWLPPPPTSATATSGTTNLFHSDRSGNCTELHVRQYLLY